MNEIKWTKSQKEASRHTRGSLLVSAAAGSGKTAVLAERCAFLVCDAPQPCDVDQLLVVTFTIAAAAEMRSRIHRALSERMIGMKGAEQQRIARQLALLEHAQVGTIHSFCSRLLRQNFTSANLDPYFKIMDVDEAALLKRETARQLFDSRYERDSGGEFAAFIDSYGDGLEGGLIDLVCKSHELLSSLPSPGQWCRETLARLADAADAKLAESKMGRELIGETERALARVSRSCAQAIARMRSLKGFESEVERLGNWRTALGQWESLLKKREFDALVSAFENFDHGRAKPVREGTPGKEQAKALMDSMKKQMRDGELADLLAFTAEQWQAGQRIVLPHARLLLELQEEFAGRFSLAKQKLGAVDFSDMEKKTLELLKGESGGPSEVAWECHREFSYVLVDEYQDVNQVQDEILRLVSTEAVAEKENGKSNLFTVGDVKQSIYRFRLAEPAQFLAREESFRRGKLPGKVIDLQENFRSHPALLRGINDFFKRLMTKEAAEIEYDVNHWLAAPAEKAGAEEASPIELHLLPAMRDEGEDEETGEDLERIEREALACAGLIRQMKMEATAEKPFDYGDVAILLRSLQYKTGQMARILRRQGIPVHHSGGRGFFEAQEVRDVMALLSVLDNQKQDIPLAAVMRSPLAGLEGPEELMGKIHAAFPEAPFCEAVGLFAESEDASGPVGLLLAKFSRWRDLARQRPLGELVWRIYEDTEYLTFVAGLEDGEQRVANLLYLHARARQFGSFLKQGLHRFMSFAAELREEMDLSQPSLEGSDRQAVRIMSIHAAKGLEFPVVILPDLGKAHNLADARGHVLLDRRSGLGMSVVDVRRQIRYPSLSSTLVAEKLRRASLAEEMRLLYVAMTRAKDRLILMGTAAAGAAQKWRQEYAGWTGPLLTEAILSARSVLDWVGPVQVACGEQTCKLLEYEAEEVRGWKVEKEKAAGASRLETVARLGPLGPPGGLTDEAKGIVSRLEFVYPHQEYVGVAAAAAATAMAGGHGAVSGVMVELSAGIVAADPSSGLSAAQIGDATHLVLEHLDYRRSCDRADVEAQIKALAQRQFISLAQAAAVDAAAIVWLASTPLGKMLKASADRLWREIPFAAAAPTASNDPMDAVMVRGRIDLLLPMEDGVAVVDYKTDRVTGEGIAARADMYRGQMEIYRKTLARVAGKKVRAVYLVFLHPRVVWTLAE